MSQHSEAVLIADVNAIVAFARQMPVFPCTRTEKLPCIKYLGPDEKWGPVNGHNSATQDEQLIRDWWREWPDALVSVPMGARSGGIVTIDFDEYKNDPASAQWVIERSTAFAGARIHKTRRGGKHYLFRSERRYKSVNGPVLAGAKRTAIDVKADGGYIVWWPFHGGEIVQGRGEFPPLPEGLIDELLHVERATPVQQTAPTPEKWQQDRPLIVAALSHIKVLGLDRNIWRDIGFAMHRHSGGAVDGYQLWLAWSKGTLTGEPELYEGDAENRKLWNNARAEREGGAVRGIGTLFRHAEAFGYRQPARQKVERAAPPEHEPPPPNVDPDTGEIFGAGPSRSSEAPPPLRTIQLPSLADIMRGETEVREWFFKDIAPAGAFLITGRPKIGKSWLLLQMGLCAADCKDFLGYEVMGQWEVLYFAPEDDDTRMQARFKAFGIDRAPANFRVITMNLFEQIAAQYAEQFTLAEFLDNFLTAHPRIKFVILDTESTCRDVWGHEAPRDAKSITRKDYAETREFDKVALKHRAFIGLVNHTSKRRNAAWIDIHELINRTNTATAGASGSIVLADPPDADPMDETQTLRVLGIRGRDVVREVLIAVEQDEFRLFQSRGPYSAAKQTKAETTLLMALEALEEDAEKKGEWHTAKQLAEEIGIKGGAAQKCITRMVKAGRTVWKHWRVETKRKMGVRLLLPVTEEAMAHE